MLAWSAWPVSAIWVFKPHVHAQCTKNQRHNFFTHTNVFRKDLDEICEISFDFLEEFCQGEMNCFIICTIGGQNNLVDIKLIIERNEQLFLNSNFYIRSEADTDLFAHFLMWIWTLFWKLSKMELDSYFSEWQCKICEETAHVDTILQIDEAFDMDLDGKIWVKCIDCGWKFHAFCVIQSMTIH